jgi:hypothetical protein
VHSIILHTTAATATAAAAAYMTVACDVHKKLNVFLPQQCSWLNALCSVLCTRDWFKNMNTVPLLRVQSSLLYVSCI